MNTPTRPALRYHGGKWKLAPWIISHLPPHKVYVEPFGGAASVLLRKPRAYAEVYNDLDEDVVNLFRVLRDEDAASRLRRLLDLTPYARAEFELAYLPAADVIERARRLLVRSFMGRGSSGVRKHRTGFRSSPYREGSTPADDWCTWPAALPALVQRLRGVIIEQKPFDQVIDRNDHPDTLFYVDPPYPFCTRSQKRIGNDLYHGYRHELDDDGHGELIAKLLDVKGMVVLSGYATPLYDGPLASWSRVECGSLADGAAARTEVLWINPRATAALDQAEQQHRFHFPAGTDAGGSTSAMAELNTARDAALREIANG